MKRLTPLSLLVLSFLSGAPLAQETPGDGESVLQMDSENKAQLPDGFRSTKTPFAKTSADLHTAGLASLSMIGCPQFSVDEFQAILAQTQKDFPEAQPHNLYVFDLREESHGFIQGHSLFWRGPRNDANKGMELSELILHEQEQLSQLEKQPVLTPSLRVSSEKYIQEGATAFALSPNALQTERAVVQKSGAHYVRIPVTDHCPPTAHQVDLFLAHLKDLPSNAIALFHCKGGWGRTTTFMTFMDIWHNHDKATCAQTVARQAAFPHALDLTHHEILKDPWKMEKSKERLKLIEQFYDYAHDPEARKHMTFREFTLRKMFERPS